MIHWPPFSNPSWTKKTCSIKPKNLFSKVKTLTRMKWKTRSSYNVVSTTSLCAAGAAWGLYRWGLLKKEWTPHWKPGSQCQPAWLAPVDVTLPREDEWLGTNRLHARSGLLPLKAFISVYFHFFWTGRPFLLSRFPAVQSPGSSCRAEKNGGYYTIR